jgi:hypothetical protein
MENEKTSQTTTKRSLFEWSLFILIHAVLVGAIGWAAFQTYGPKLGAWVFASAFIAGCVSLFFFHVEVKGETLMKIVLAIAVACNAGYLIHNGAKAAGVESFNLAQVKKFEAGVSAASKTTSKTIAHQIGLSATQASKLDKAFGDEVATIAALLGFIELALSLVFFAVGTARARVPKDQAR